MPGQDIENQWNQVRSGPPRERSGRRKVLKRYWLTPPEVYNQLNDEFHFDFDPCPSPGESILPFDGLGTQWGKMNYVNPPFKSEHGSPTAWARKAIEQKNLGRGSVLLLPTQSYVNLLLEAGAELRPLGRIRWLAVEDHEPTQSPSPITAFILRPS